MALPSSRLRLPSTPTANRPPPATHRALPRPSSGAVVFYTNRQPAIRTAAALVRLRSPLPLSRLPSWLLSAPLTASCPSSGAVVFYTNRQPAIHTHCSSTLAWASLAPLSAWLSRFALEPAAHLRRQLQLSTSTTNCGSCPDSPSLNSHYTTTTLVDGY